MGSVPSSQNWNGKTSFESKYMLTTKQLGEGAFATVKLGVDLQTTNKVAVKIVDTSKLSTNAKDSLETEIEILTSLSEHKKVVRLINHYNEGNKVYLVLEYMEGGELFDRIVQKSKYSEREARDLIKSLVETLDSIHSRKIVHRDLKPENLLLASDSNDTDVKIADFGFAKRLENLLPNECPCGSPGYVAPEVLKAIPYQAEVDVWSLGVICYVLLAGYPPFYDEDQSKLFKKIKQGNFRFHNEYWKHISPEACDLIQSMLQVKQKKRATTSQLLKHKWLSMDGNQLEDKDLTPSITVMKSFNARRRLRAAADAIILANRMEKFGKVSSSKKIQKPTNIIDPDALEASDIGTEEDTEEVPCYMDQVSEEDHILGPKN